MKRRTFIETVGLAVGGTLLGGGVFAQARTSADVAFVNGVVLTMDPSRPVAEAVAVRAGHIGAVGSRRQIEALCDRQTQIVDLRGGTLTPGLIDAHTHLIAFGQMEKYLVIVRPPQVHDFHSLGEALAEAAAEVPRGEWIMARGFNEFDEGRFPTRQELDESVPNHPVLAVQWTGQYGVCNTMALERANLLSADARDPYGGKFLRDRRTGIPNGMLLHYPAIYAVYAPEYTPEQEQEAGVWGARRMLACGVTCVHDNFCTGRAAKAYFELARAKKLPMRVRLYPYVNNIDTCRQMISQLPHNGGPMLRAQGIKLAIDGFPLMYEVAPEHEVLNIPMHPPDQFQAIINAIHRADWQVDVHAAGDRGVDLTLDAFSKAAGGDRAVQERRHRIEHAMVSRHDSIRRMADMNVPVCTQPAWIRFRADELMKRIDPEVVGGMVALQSMRQAGVHVSYGADVPASPTHLPLDSIVGAVTRRTDGQAQMDPSEKVTFMDALQAHTIDAAYAAFDEQDMGSIEVGKYGDLAVWAQDLRRVNEADLDGLEVAATYIGGREVYRA